MLSRPLVRRLVSPAGLVLVAICLALPFVAVSCEESGVSVTAEYSGTDLLVGGTPEVTVTGDDVARESAEEETDDPMDVQPVAILALVAILAGIGVAALPKPRQRLFGGAAAAIVTVLLLASTQVAVQGYLANRIKQEVGSELPPGRSAGSYVESRYGFWLALLLAVGVALWNSFEVFRHRRAVTSAAPDITTTSSE